MNLAVISDPEPALACSKVPVSKGQVASVEEAVSAFDGEGNLVFNWTDNCGTGTAKGNDKAILVAYFTESKQAVFQFSEATRSDGSAILLLNSKKGTAKIWLGFLSTDEKMRLIVFIPVQ